MTSLPRSSPPSLRFDALDGIRGLAAMAVMVDHYTHQSRLHGAWAVVDLFFMLSGFVLCHSHAQKISQGQQGFLSFMWSRLHRLAPLYWVACLMGAVAAGLTLHQRPSLHIDLTTLLETLAGALLFVPNFGPTLWPHGDSIRGAMLFPLNPPSWTTFFQLMVNVVFFLALTRLPVRSKLTAALLALAAVNGLEWYADSINPGWGQGNFLMGWPRALIEFWVGVALYRAHQRLPMLPPWLALLPLAAFMLSFLVNNEVLHLVSVVVLAPLTIAAAARTRLPAQLSRIGQRLGELSYPLYIAHMPMWGIVLILLPLPGTPGALRTALACVAALLCAAALVPLERWLRARLPRA